MIQKEREREVGMTNCHLLRSDSQEKRKTNDILTIGIQCLTSFWNEIYTDDRLSIR